MGKTIMVEARYVEGETAIRLRDGRTATKRQYNAALTRLRAPVGDGLKVVDRRVNPDGSRVQSEIVVYDGDRAWALIS